MSETIFSKIIAGEIPCYKVYESEHVLAFLDINPLAPGHTLVIPKTPAAELHELPVSAAMACMMAVHKIGKAIKGVTGCEGYNILQNNGTASGQEVMHVHFHIIPRVEGDGLGYRWNAGSLEQADATAMLEKLQAAL